jgi:hypothetical protein
MGSPTPQLGLKSAYLTRPMISSPLVSPFFEVKIFIQLFPPFAD